MRNERRNAVFAYGDFIVLLAHCRCKVSQKVMMRKEYEVFVSEN